jgi:4-carboxymuconolactone decarboxylase
MSRFSPISRENLSPAQAEVYNSISAGARGGVRGPFHVLLQSPELAKRVEQLGLYTRFQCKVPERLRELSINLVARHWQADYEWYAHSALALKQGISEEVMEAIGAGRRPVFAQESDEVVYDYVSSLLADGRVSDAVFQRARGLLGETGIVDLTGLVGYYTLLALTLNAFEVPIPEDGKVPWSK